MAGNIMITCFRIINFIFFMKNVFIVLGLVAAFFAGYMFSQKYNFSIETKKPSDQAKASIAPTAEEEPLVGNDQDENGCKSSAGYSWCEEKQKCLREWEEPCVDEALIKQALVDKHGWNPDDIVVTVSKSTGRYVSGGVREKSSEVGGGMFFAVKTDGQWKIIFDGNGAIMCESLKDYQDLPVSMIGECYDETTGRNLKR